MQLYKMELFIRVKEKMKKLLNYHIKYINELHEEKLTPMDRTYKYW